MARNRLCHPQQRFDGKAGNSLPIPHPILIEIATAVYRWLDWMHPKQSCDLALSSRASQVLTQGRVHIQIQAEENKKYSTLELLLA
jgi:hypothetical protein